jgi:hypothetical protein
MKKIKIDDLIVLITFICVLILALNKWTKSWEITSAITFILTISFLIIRGFVQCVSLIRIKKAVSPKTSKIINFVAGFIKSNDMESLDHFISDIDISRTDTDELVGYLSAIYPIKSKIPSRVKFRNGVRQELMERGEDASLLMKGI